MTWALSELDSPSLLLVSYINLCPHPSNSDAKNELNKANIKIEPDEEMIIEEIIDGQTHVINPPKSSSSTIIKEEVVFDMDDQPIGNILNSVIGNNGEMHIGNCNGNAPVKAEFVENDSSDQVGFKFMLALIG